MKMRLRGILVSTLAALAVAGPALAGEYDLVIEEKTVNVTGRERPAMTVNGSIPGPVLRMREGEEVTIRVTNRLSELTSIHWHGILLPANMDGVPILSFDGIAPGETFTYRFPVKQSGTYWYHSHSGLQEQSGVYGPLVIDPAEPAPYRYDREYVVMLSDWTDEDPHRVLSNLKKQSDYYNWNKRTVFDFFRDVGDKGWDVTVRDRLDWGAMRRDPTDIADVSGYTFLVNGQPPAANWTALFKPGERVRLRFINGSAMSFFDVRIPGLRMQVVQADGQDVAPVTVDKFRIAVAETYDVIVEPKEHRAYTVFAESIDRSGYARATLAPREGMAAEIPTMRPRQILTMADMGAAHGGMSGMQHDMPAQDQQPGGAHGAGHEPPGAMPAMDHGSMGGMQHKPGTQKTWPAGDTASDQPQGSTAPHSAAGAGDHSGMTMPMQHGAMQEAPAGGGATAMGHSAMGHGSAGQPAAQPMEQEGHGIATAAGRSGPEHVGHQMPPRGETAPAGAAHGGMAMDDGSPKILSYADLRAVVPNYDTRPPEREILVRLTGNMERYFWSINDKKFSKAEPIKLRHGERVRIKFVNETMMNHPMHLHGMWMEIENGNGANNPRKHTVNVPPGQTVYADVTADALGQWAFHCHLLYHMDTGMFRTVVVANVVAQAE